MPSENQTLHTLHPVSDRELRYDRLGIEFRFLERFLDDENQTELDGLLWVLADQITYNDEREKEILELLEAVESIVADDACEEWDCIEALHPNELTDREKQMHEKLSAVYRLIHGSNPNHICYHVHEDWRKEAGDRIRAMRDEAT